MTKLPAGDPRANDDAAAMPEVPSAAESTLDAAEDALASDPAAASDEGSETADDESVRRVDAEISDAVDDDADGTSAETDGGDEPERLYTKADVARLEAEAQERLLRVMAEYDNFRRRTAREREKWTAEALEEFVKDLLPVFDSFEKARAVETDDVAGMREGLVVTHKQLAGVLSRYSIDVIDPVGEPFDPELHEALMRRPSPDHESGTVITVFERGYKLGARLLRPARTVVADDDV